MQVVARIVRGQKFRRLTGIPRGGVEIDDAVVLLAGTNPFVHRGALGLAFRGPVAGAFKWRQRRTVDLEAARVRSPDELPVRRDEIGGGWQRVGPCLTDVVD